MYCLYFPSEIEVDCNPWFQLADFGIETDEPICSSHVQSVLE